MDSVKGSCDMNFESNRQVHHDDHDDAMTHSIPNFADHHCQRISHVAHACLDASACQCMLRQPFVLRCIFSLSLKPHGDDIDHSNIQYGIWLIMICHRNS